MSTIKLKGSSSGEAEVTVAAAAGTPTFTLPTTVGSANQLLKNSGTAGTLEYASGVSVDSSGRLLLGTTDPGEGNGDEATFYNNGNAGITIRSAADADCRIYFSEGTSGGSQYRGAIHYDHDTHNMAFSANENDRFRIESSGNVNVLDGDLVIGTAGHGIDFSATSGPTNTTGTSDTSELLDDYEEGTFTPIFYKGTPGSNSQPSYNFQYGSYTKIGNVVTVRFSIGFANSGTYSECHIGGMPYSLNLPSNHFYYYQLNGYSWASGYSNSGGDKSLYLFLTADSNSTHFAIKKEDDKPAAGEEAIGSSQRLTGEFSYRTA